MTNQLQGVAFQYISQNKSCTFSTPQRTTICNHPSGCRTISQRRLPYQRWESYRNQNSNVFVNHFAVKGDIYDDIQQSLPLGEFERISKEHINEYGPVQAYNNTLYERVMIDRMERVAKDRFLGQPLMDVINNNENEAHFNSLVDHNYSRQQAENLSYNDLNRFNPASYNNCQNYNYPQVRPFIKEPPSSERFGYDVVQIINPSRDIAMNSYTKVGQNQQQDVNSNKSLTEKSSSCFKSDLSQKNRQIMLSKRDQCVMVEPCGIQNIIVSPRKNRNVPVNLTATGVNDQDSVLNFTDNCYCEFLQWKDLDTTSHQSPEAERNLSCHEFQQPICRNCRQCPAAKINMNLPDSRLKKCHCNNSTNIIVPCRNVHNRQYINCKICQDKNLDETIKESEKCLLEKTTSIQNMTINSLSKGQAEKKENYVSHSVTAKNNADKTTENIYTLPSEYTENNVHALLSESTEKIYVPLPSESTENNVHALLSESTKKIYVPLPSESTENNVHALLRESTEKKYVPLPSESTKNNVHALLSESTEKIHVPRPSESTENNAHALLSESTEKINVASLPSESTENMNVDPLLCESTESNVIHALPSTSNLPQTDTTENGMLQNEKQLENVNVVQNENTKKMNLLNDNDPSLLLTENRNIENIKRNVKRREKRQSKADSQLMVEAIQFLCRGDNSKNMKLDCFMEEPISTRQKSSAKKCIERGMVKKLSRTSYVEKLTEKLRQDEFPSNSQKKKKCLSKNGTKCDVFCDDDTSGRNRNDSGTNMSGIKVNNYDNRNATELNMNHPVINDTQDTEKSFGEPLCCTQTQTESELKTLNKIHVADQIVNANGEETGSDTSYVTCKMLEAATSDRQVLCSINPIYSSKEIDVLEPYENEIHQNHYFYDTNGKQMVTLLQEVQNELHSGNQTKNEEQIPSSVSADVTSIKDSVVTNASLVQSTLIEEKSSGIMKVQNITSCLSVENDADTSPIVRKPCWKSDNLNSSGKWPIPILDRLNLDLSKGQEILTMPSEKLCVNQPDFVHKDHSASISPQSKTNSSDAYEWISGVDTVVQHSSNKVRGVVIDVAPSAAKKLRKGKMLKLSCLSQGGDVSVPVTRSKAKQIQKESKLKEQKTYVNVTSKKDELAKECSENRSDEVVEKNCSQIEEKKSDSSRTNGTSGKSTKRALKRKQYDGEGNKSKEKVHATCNSSNESMELDSGDQLNLDKSKILEKTISEINVENNIVTMATKKTPKRKLEFDKEKDYLEIDIGENMKHQNIKGKKFKRSCSTNNTGDSSEIVQSNQTAKRKLYPDNETGEPKVNKTEASDVKLNKSETDRVDKWNRVVSKRKKKTKSKRNTEDVIEPIPCDQIDKSCSRSSESQLNRKDRKIQNSSNKKSKLITSTNSVKKTLETKLKSWKKMSGQKMKKSSMATNMSNDGKVQFRLVTEPAEQQIVKLKTEAMKKFYAVKTCAYCHMTVPSRHSINHVKIHHPYRCAKCRLLFSTKEEKSRHRRETHITQRYHCITCDKLFYMKSFYEKHVASSIHKKARAIYRRAVDIMRSHLGLGVEPACHGMTMLTDGSSSTAVDSINAHNAIISTGQVDSLFSNLEDVSFSQHEPEVEKLLKDFSDVKSFMLSNNAAAFYSCNNVSEQMSQTYIYTANTKCTDDNAQLPVDAYVSHSMNYPTMIQNPLAIENCGASSSIVDVDEGFRGYIKNTDDRSEFSAVNSSLEADQSVTSPTKRLISDAFQLLESDGYYDNDHFKSVDLDGNVDLYDIDVLNDLLEMTDKQLADLKVDFSNV